MEFKPRKLDTFALVTSITTSVGLSALAIFFLLKDIPFNWLFALLLIFIIAASYGLSPKNYYFQGGNLIIEKVIGNKIIIPVNEIERVDYVQNFMKLKPLRSMGNGGLFGYYGMFETREYGNINCQLTSMKDVVIIKSKKGYYAISPENPERMLEFFQSLAPASHKEISKPEHSTKRANPLILLIPDTIFAITLIMVILLYPRLPDRIATHFDATGNPDQWNDKIVFIYLSVIPQFILLLSAFLMFFIGRNKYRNPHALYLMIIVLSFIQIVVAFFSFDLYWFNINGTHFVPLGYFILVTAGILILLLWFYNRILTKNK
ncbi:MAG: PH domain-containing protein [candidate division WOR-3 bacterium]|nr:PH domain-containing protein [candidate division WOR-3 bacterium]